MAFHKTTSQKKEDISYDKANNIIYRAHLRYGDHCNNEEHLACRGVYMPLMDPIGASSAETGWKRGWKSKRFYYNYVTRFSYL
jgi:hypothetical protein